MRGQGRVRDWLSLHDDYACEPRACERKILQSRSSHSASALGWSRPFSKDVMPERLFSLMVEAGLLERQGALWRSKVRFSTLNGDLFMHSAFPTTARDAVFFGPDTYKFVDAVDAWLAGPFARTSPGSIRLPSSRN